MMFFFSFLSALFVSLVIMPPLMRVSRHIGLVDVPNARKVHDIEIPVCGGIAIAVGTLLPVLMWSPLDRAMISYLVGAAVIVLMGIRDDAKPLDYKWKLVGQIVAVACVMSGSVAITHLPFFGLDAAPRWITLPVTFFFLLGVTNAVNLFDGLDGLAGGCVILSLSAIAVLSYQAGQDAAVLVLVALAVAGSICGFLRYNTHPATVFMGDAGSQFLGFTTAVLSILLTDRFHPALNPGLPLLLLGLPLLDTMVVITQRLAHGRSPFTADKNHIHHQLLGLGFRHLEAVSLIYLVQGAMVGTALYLRYASDIMVVTAFVAISALLLVPLYTLQAFGWRAHPPPPEGHVVERRNLWLRRRTWLPGVSTALLRYGVVTVLVVGACVPVPVSRDFSVLALGVAGFSLAASFVARTRSLAIFRLSVYVSAAMVAHLFVTWYGNDAVVGWVLATLLTMMSLLLIVAIRVTRRNLFAVMPQDLLVLFIAIVVPNLSGETHTQFNIGQVAVVFIVLLYCSEFLLRRDEEGRWIIQFGALLSLFVIGIRPLLW